MNPYAYSLCMQHPLIQRMDRTAEKPGITAGWASRFMDTGGRFMQPMPA
ncbi:MAG: hypothetical protein GX610_09885 [Rhodococcus sp.]|nr:hypothetical protein [Rhodococcus sp. (in: high G+C Gram-positive bacteria)]